MEMVYLNMFAAILGPAHLADLHQPTLLILLLDQGVLALMQDLVVVILHIIQQLKSVQMCKWRNFTERTKYLKIFFLKLSEFDLFIYKKNTTKLGRKS